jgi:uncharacterized membrane protein YcaP (DUF421 family)
MESFEIHLSDWSRIVFGNVPPEFFVEVIIRVIFVYLLVIFCIRLMGKRMASQLSRNELVAISSLAASIGIPIQTPERGLLPGLLVALIVVAAQRIISSRLARDGHFERRSQGNISTLVQNGVLQIKAMEKARISRAELFARLRSRQILHLGMVKRFYFEAEGDFTLIRETGSRTGLSVLPVEDPAFLAEQDLSPEIRVCKNCGAMKAERRLSCDHCGHKEYVAGTN